MGREQTRKEAEVMLAFAEGREVEFRSVYDYHCRKWRPCVDPLWNWECNEYRVEKRVVYVNEYGDRLSCYASEEEARRRSSASAKRVAVKYIEADETE